MEEKRKWIEGYQGLYWITNTGRVISADRYDSFNRHHGGERKQQTSKNGYKFVVLYNNGKGHMMYIHRLVALAFIPNPENKPEVDHIDNNKSNNIVSNLSWVSRKENQNNPITRKRMLENPNKYASQVGSKNPFSRKVRVYSLDGKYIRDFDCVSAASKEFNIPLSAITRVCLGQRGQTHGFRFEYLCPAKKKIVQINKKEPSNKRPIIQYSKDGKYIAEYESVADAARNLGIIMCNIVHAAKGDLKTYKGYKWKYKE